MSEKTLQDVKSYRLRDTEASALGPTPIPQPSTSTGATGSGVPALGRGAGGAPGPARRMPPERVGAGAGVDAGADAALAATPAPEEVVQPGNDGAEPQDPEDEEWVLSDEEWLAVAEHIPPQKPGGRPRKTDMRLVVDAILFKSFGPVPWRDLPERYQPYQTIYDYFRRWCRDGTWAKVEATLEGLRGEPLGVEGVRSEEAAADPDPQAAEKA